MAKLNKAFIPLGICGGFMSLSLVTGLALTSTMNTRYIPEEIVIEGAGGTDIQSEDPSELNTTLKKVKVYSGTYYDGLKELDYDPEPDPYMYNSIAITCDGEMINSYSTVNRKLVVTQNHEGAFYQVNGYEIKNGLKYSQNALIGISKYGMFVKFNEYKIEKDDPSAEINEASQVAVDAIMKNRGKWYQVELKDEHKVDESSYYIPTSTSDIYKSYAMYLTQEVADSWHDQFINALNENKESILGGLINVLDKADFEQTGTDYYRAEYNGIDISLSLNNKSKPVFDLNGGGNNQKITIEHIDNTKVRIVQSGSGDFYDMMGDDLYAYVKKTMGSYGGYGY